MIALSCVTGRMRECPHFPASVDGNIGAAPIVDSRSRAHYLVTAASDSRAKRSKFEEEAEECSDCDAVVMIRTL